MKKLFLTFLIMIFIALQSNAQQIATTTNGNKVFLYKNGTWKYAKYIKAKFVGYEQGDLSHYIFRDNNGKKYIFNNNKDDSYNLLIEDKTSPFGDLILNPKYKNKYFDIFYTVEKQDLMGWGNKEDYYVIIKLKML